MVSCVSCGCSLTPKHKTCGVTFHRQVPSTLNDWAPKGTTLSWRKAQGCRQANELIRMPGDAKATSKWLKSRSRCALRSLVGVMTAHCGLNRHLHLLGISDSPACPLCRTAEETLYHFLGVCHHWWAMRRRLLGACSLSCTELSSLEFRRILAFVRETGLLGGEEAG
ncbi:hypothetical protein HUJ04_011334 [Dendroctonus ponderosae]|nr:hypothetical protein HUJ04_011334 [Dendroctonus ponderosae]